MSAFDDPADLSRAWCLFLASHTLAVTLEISPRDFTQLCKALYDVSGQAFGYLRARGLFQWSAGKPRGTPCISIDSRIPAVRVVLSVYSLRGLHCSTGTFVTGSDAWSKEVARKSAVMIQRTEVVRIIIKTFGRGST